MSIAGTPRAAHTAPLALRSATLRTWHEPAAAAARATLVVLVGRGETAEVYERFGRRLAAAGFRVVAVGQDHPAPAAVGALLAGLPAPHVVVGADAGALAAVRVARAGHADAVVLAGLPTSAGVQGLAWQAELDARTTCPAHRRVLGHATRSSLFADATAIVTADLVRPDDAPLDVPLLALHGGADPVSPVAHAVAAYRVLGARAVEVVADGRHDVLNDVDHAAVATTLLTFLDELDGTAPREVARPAPAGYAVPVAHLIAASA